MEIERKFLVEKKPENIECFQKLHIVQAYISTSPVIRLRRSNDNFYLTVKGSGSVAREEFELPIAMEDYHRLLLKAEGRAIEKNRYLIPLEGGLVAELDIYYGYLWGLETVEVEFSSIEEADNFRPPFWFGCEVSLDKRYKNSSLSAFGLPEAP